MERFIITMQDYTDFSPLKNINLEMDIWVVPLYMRDNILTDIIDSNNEDIDFYIKKQQINLFRDPIPNFSSAEKIKVIGTSDDFGRVIIESDLTGMYDKVRTIISLDTPPIQVVGLIRDVKITFELFNRIDKTFIPLFKQENINQPLDYKEEEKKFILLVDRASTILGHTTATSAQLCFQVFNDLPSIRFNCRINSIESREPAYLKDIPVIFDPLIFNIACVTFENLLPDTEYGYSLTYVAKSWESSFTSPIEISKGTFKTSKIDNSVTEFIFASCNKPTGYENPFERWEALAKDKNYDFLLLLGDQIYEDGIKEMPEELTAAQNIEEEILSWSKQYVKNYNYFWLGRSIRLAMRNKPIYCIHDDHEIADDYGTLGFRKSKFDEFRYPREDAALQVYQYYQNIHNPNGVNLQHNHNGKPIYDFGIEKGKTAFYILNTRSNRPVHRPGPEVVHPVLGTDQYDRFVQWSDSDPVQNADVIFIGLPIPPVFLPSELIHDILNSRAAQTILKAVDYGDNVYSYLQDSILGDLGYLGKPPIIGAALIAGVIGAIVGLFGGGADETDSLEYTMDIKERLDYGNNRKDLKNVLDILFNLMEGKTRIKKNRAVFILSGDVHLGGFHTIFRRKEGTAAEINGSLLQITSSGISHAPSITEQALREYADLISKYTSVVINAAIGFTNGPTYRSIGSALIEEIRKKYYNLFYALDDDAIRTIQINPPSQLNPLGTWLKSFPAKYFGHPEDILMERNFGRVRIENVSNRVYRFYFSIEGKSDSIFKALEINLDEPTPKYKDLIGGIEAIEDTISLLRLQQSNDSYGVNVDKSNDEVILHLTNRPDWFFSLPLRQNSSILVSQLILEQLQDAFYNKHKVRIEYLRTGIHIGKIFRIN